MVDDREAAEIVAEAAGEICEVVVTGPDLDWLAALTRSLIEDRLAACGQHIASIRSVYRWQGRIEDETEARVALHTRLSLVPAILERVLREHPYEVPCVLAIPVLSANPAYTQWVLAETQDPQG
ncbi:divalent-cation tolerance protein CutA [Naasia sp. SYSU D00948]|uniref:divalent-cation tolerance protein CutA n=1 Tax=Naasia sp. SYSU D00948 TaxID=2817379 RepID=UPI001B300974|nr:divalent-cation tolerance protein CutA [Naasia sp. SYSU D00948]